PTSLCYGWPIFAAAEENLFFWASSCDIPLEPGLWVSDGTAEGTRLIFDPAALGLDKGSDYLTVANGRVYFELEGEPRTEGFAAELEMWVSDGTPEGTLPLRQALNLHAWVRPGRPVWIQGRQY